MTKTPKRYEVTITSKVRTVGLNQVDVEYIVADSGSEAIKLARATMKRNGWTRQDGPLEYRARIARD